MILLLLDGAWILLDGVWILLDAVRGGIFHLMVGLTTARIGFSCRVVLVAKC